VIREVSATGPECAPTRSLFGDAQPDTLVPWIPCSRPPASALDRRSGAGARLPVTPFGQGSRTSAETGSKTPTPSGRTPADAIARR
jgi:hypothetical protein